MTYNKKDSKKLENLANIYITMCKYELVSLIKRNERDNEV